MGGGGVVQNYYRVLGVPENANVAEIRRAYRRLARRHHPDVGAGGDSSPFLSVREAYDTLSDERRRRRYDDRLAAERAMLRADRSDRFDWFADEVAIDFPSISAVIDRMRVAFLAPDEPARPLSAEVLLSAREAFEGVVVPLDVPVRRVCRSCGGRGETWAEPCEACQGSGEALVRHPVQLVIPPRAIDGMRFHLRVSAPFAPLTRVEVRLAVR